MRVNIQELKNRFLGLRNKLKITQEEAAELFGVRPNTWQSWEWGTHAPSFPAVKLLEYYETNPPEKMDIPKMCKTIRENLGLTRGAMAKKLGVNPNSWGDWERGLMKPSNKHIDTIERMFKELQEKGTLQKAS